MTKLNVTRLAVVLGLAWTVVCLFWLFTDQVYRGNGIDFFAWWLAGLSLTVLGTIGLRWATTGFGSLEREGKTMSTEDLKKRVVDANFNLKTPEAELAN